MSKIGNSARKAKIWIIVILLALLMVFVLSNLKPQPIYFLWLKRSVSVSLALIVAAGIGFLAGILWGARKAQPKS